MTIDIPNEQMKTISVPHDSMLNEDVLRSVDALFKVSSPPEFRDSLIEIYTMYILHEHKDLPEDFGAIAERMTVLIEFFRRVPLTQPLTE
jgi:hypothetical protein